MEKLLKEFCETLIGIVAVMGGFAFLVALGVGGGSLILAGLSSKNTVLQVLEIGGGAILLLVLFCMYAKYDEMDHDRRIAHNEKIRRNYKSVLGIKDEDRD